MKYSIEEITAWSIKGEVTKAEVVLDLLDDLIVAKYKFEVIQRCLESIMDDETKGEENDETNGT